MLTLPVAAIVFASLMVRMLYALRLRLLRKLRRDLRAPAEALLIRRHSLERTAKTPTDFRRNWARELEILRRIWAKGVVGRLLIRPNDIRAALDAQFV